MKKICMMLAVCLALGCLSGCGASHTSTIPTDTSPSETEPTPTDTVATEPPETTEPTEPTVPKIIGYDLEVPEEFTITTSEDDQVVYQSTQRDDLSSIVYRVLPLDESVLQWDEETFLNQQHPEQSCESITLQQTWVDGQAALFADYVLLQDDEASHLYTYLVIGTESNYQFTFCDCTEDAQWLDAFAQAAATINLLMENEGIALDYSHLQRYSLPCGLSFFAAPNMQEQQAPGFSACIGSREALILVLKDDKAEHNLTELTLAEYADLVSQANELDGFSQDNYGNLHVDFYSSDDDGMRYFNNLTVKESADSFWVIQMTCTASNQAAYDREFALWATSITPDA